MATNPLVKLQDFGQSVWLDFIHREMIHNGELQKLIDEDGLRGMTSNPKIFDDAISKTDAYDDTITELASSGKSPLEVYEAIAVEDVRSAAERFRPLHEASGGAYGYVSLEVNPHLAHDTEGTIEEARRLWSALNSPNVHIKVPGTQAGLPAIRTLISEGINVNVTLLFGLDRYRAVAESYVAGLEDRVANGNPLGHVHSVASFFLSRIDVLIDKMLDVLIQAGGPKGEQAANLRGEVAIASAKQARKVYREVFEGERFAALKVQTPRPQYLLWASTSTKDPAYPDTKYVEPLIGPDTVNTLPRETVDAYRDHGDPASRLDDNLDRAHDVLQALPDLGIDLGRVTQQLEDEGVQKFNDPFDSLIETLEKKCASAV